MKKKLYTHLKRTIFFPSVLTDLQEDLRKEMDQFREHQEKIISILQNEPATAFALKVLKKTNASLASLTTQDSVLQLYAVQQHFGCFRQ